MAIVVVSFCGCVYKVRAPTPYLPTWLGYRTISAVGSSDASPLDSEVGGERGGRHSGWDDGGRRGEPHIGFPIPARYKERRCLEAFGSLVQSAKALTVHRCLL